MRPRTFSPSENNDPQRECSHREGKMQGDDWLHEDR